MANISKIQLPDGSTYNIKDSSSLHESFDELDISTYLRHDGRWINPNFETTDNKVVSFESSVSDTQYPSAKLVYDTIKDNEIVTAIAINDLTENKQDKLTAGENITIIDNVISATGGSAEGKEDVSNKVTTIDEDSTDVQYPSAKAVYDIMVENELIIAESITQLDEDKQDKLIAGENITIVDNVISSIGGSVEGKEDVSNKVTILDASVTDVQYPSAKVVYDTITETEEVISIAINELNASKQDKLTAGENITIIDNVISATGGDVYTKEEVDDLLDEKQDVLTQGANITISGSTISATDTVYDDTEVRDLIDSKQDNLVSGTNIKTVNGNSLLGSGNIEISGGESYDDTELRGLISTNATNISNLTTTVNGKADAATTLAGYGINNAYTKTEVDGFVNAKQDTLTQGTNITINGNVISAIDTVYDDTEVRNLISAKQDTLTQGTNITINGNVISATDTVYDDTEVRGLINTNTTNISELQTSKQDTLIGTQTSGQNIKTINGQSLLGTGNIAVNAAYTGISPIEVDNTNHTIGFNGDIFGDWMNYGNGIDITREGGVDTINTSTIIAGTTTVTSLTSLPNNYREIHAIITDSGILSFSQQPQEGYPIEIYIDHQAQGGSDELDNIIVTLPDSGNYECVCPNTVTILKGEFARITARTFGGKTYIDAQTFYYIDTPERYAFSVGETVEGCVLRYNGWILGMTDSHTTTSTTEIGEAILDDHFKFNIICETSGRIKIQSMANRSYYITQTPGWGTSAYEIYFDGTHLTLSNKTDGGDRLYMSNATTLAKSAKNTPVSAWVISQPKKTAK